MKQDNKEPDPSDSLVRRIGVQIQRWLTINRRTVHDQMLSGAAYSLGSGAVSLIVIWFEHRH
ncbi:hypothetical protein [Streptomyces sp. NPDC002172]